MDAAFAALPPIPAGRGLLQLELTALMAGDRVLAQGLQLRLRGPDKVLIIGANGGGKTTLLRHIQQRLMERGIRTGWMPQRYEEELPDRLTPIEYLHTDGDKDQLTRIRTTLGAMKFTREETMHPIRDLSGGQKAKVLLLRLLLREPEVLLMDEPTRNLSPLSAPVMREIICSFPGAVVCVTHDRVLMAQWPGRILRLTPEGLQTVDWTEFQG